MFNDHELQEEINEAKILCDEAKEIDIDVPGDNVTIRFDYEKYRQQKERQHVIHPIADILSVQLQSETQIRQQEAIRQELHAFMRDHGDLSQDERYSDIYHYRIAAFYEQLGNYEKERESLMRIKDKTQPVFSEKIAANNLRRAEHSAENLKILHDLNTADAIRKLSGFYAAQKQYDKAEDALCHYADTHSDIPYELYFQYAYVSIMQGNTNKAVSLLKQAYYARPTAESATTLALLYLAQSARNVRLYKKAIHWCNIAVQTDIHFAPALTLLVNIQIEQNPDGVEQQLERFLTLKAAQKTDDIDSIKIQFARCAFIKEKYSLCLERLQDITQAKDIGSAVWNNIALCNEGMGNLARAERNIQKALEKYQQESLQSDTALQTILTNYMRILNRQAKYKETVRLFDAYNGSHKFVLSEHSYLHYFAHYGTALRKTGQIEQYITFLQAAFLHEDVPQKVKVFACNDIIRVFTQFGIAKDMVMQCATFMEACYRADPHNARMRGLLNNIVFTYLETDTPIPNDIFSAFVSSIERHYFTTATFGLYQFKVLHNIERGIAYYEKAITIARSTGESVQNVEEIKCKKDLETARTYLAVQETNIARRLLQSLIKHCPKTLEGYRQRAETLLKKC